MKKFLVMLILVVSLVGCGAPPERNNSNRTDFYAGFAFFCANSLEFKYSVKECQFLVKKAEDANMYEQYLKMNGLDK